MRVNIGRQWQDRGPRRENCNVVEDVAPLVVTASHSIDGTIITTAKKRTALHDRPRHGMVNT